MRTPYAGLEDVRAHLSFIPTFTATSKPNASQVYQFLADAANDLDAALAQADYSVPVATGATVAYDQLRTWSAIGAAWYTALAMPQGSDSKHAKDLGDRWQALITDVQEGRKAPTEAGQDTNRSRMRHGEGAQPSSRFTDDQTLR